MNETLVYLGHIWYGTRAQKPCAVFSLFLRSMSCLSNSDFWGLAGGRWLLSSLFSNTNCEDPPRAALFPSLGVPHSSNTFCVTCEYDF